MLRLFLLRKGGEDAPSNIVLLCKRCHVDGPNVTDPEIMWDWIRSYGVPFYDTFWGVIGRKEYKFIYKKSVVQELEGILASAGLKYDAAVENKIKEILDEVIDGAGIHFGHPYFNAATMAGINRMMLKRLASFYGVTFPLEEEKDMQSTSPWWME